MGTFQFSLRGEAIGVLALPLKGEGEPSKRLVVHAPIASNRCVLTMKWIVLLSFISFKMGGWIVVHGEGVRLLLRAVDFGGHLSLQSHATCKLISFSMEIFICC